MRRVLLSFGVCLLLMGAQLQAQDVIVFKNGEELKAKVMEVGIGEVKYKKTDNPNGPLYTSPKASIFMIRYENGSKDVFAGAAPPAGEGPRDMHGHMKPDAKGDYNTYMRLYRKHLAGGIVMTAVGAPLIPIGLGLTIGGFAISADGHNNNWDNNGPIDGAPMIVGGGLLLAAGITCVVVGPIKIKMAKRYKAKAREIGPSMSFAPIVSPGLQGQAMRTGAGVRINF